MVWSGVLGCIYLDWFLIELALCSEVSTPILLQLASSSRQSWRMKLSTAFATALLLAGGVSAESKSSKAAALERFWSYGRSEPVYPTRKVSSKKIARLELFFFLTGTIFSRDTGLGRLDKRLRESEISRWSNDK